MAKTKNPPKNPGAPTGGPSGWGAKHPGSGGKGKSPGGKGPGVGQGPGGSRGTPLMPGQRRRGRDMLPGGRRSPRGRGAAGPGAGRPGGRGGRGSDPGRGAAECMGMRRDQVEAKARNLLGKFQRTRDATARGMVLDRLGRLADAASTCLTPQTRDRIRTLRETRSEDTAPTRPTDERPTDPGVVTPEPAEDGEPTDDTSTLPPELQALLDRMPELEGLLNMKGLGKKALKNIWKKVKIHIGDVYKASRRGAISTAGDAQSGGQYAEQGAAIMKAGDDVKDSRMAPRYAEAGATQGFGRSRTIGPGGTGIFRSMNDEGGLLPEGELLPGLYPDGAPVDLPPELLPGGMLPEDLYAWNDLLPGGPVPEGGYPDNVVYETPGAATPLPGTDWYIPEYGGLPATDILPEPEESYDAYDAFVPVENDDMYFVGPGGAPKVQVFDDDMVDGEGLEPATPLESNYDLYSGYVDSGDLTSSYNSPSIDSGVPMNEDTAYEALDLMGEQLGDAEAVLQRYVEPGIARLRQAARATGDPALFARASGAAYAARLARRAANSTASNLDAIESSGLSGFPALSALGGGPVLLLTLASVVAFSLAASKTPLPASASALGQGASIGLGAGLPILAVLAGAKLLRLVG